MNIVRGRTRADIATSKGRQGITATPNGGPDFRGTGYIYNTTPGQEAVVTIIMTGSRDADFKAANIAAGILNQPKDYTWHHVDDYDPVTNTCTMQLVITEVHEDTTKHMGACGQYSIATGKDYKK